PVAVAAWALAAESEEEAHRLAASARMTLTLLRRGRLIPVPPPEEALRFLEREGRGATPGRRAIVGTPDQVRAGLEDLAASYGAEEVIVLTVCHDHGARRRSYEHVAEAFALRGAVPARG